jgi:hypothetical protein
VTAIWTVELEVIKKRRQVGMGRVLRNFRLPRQIACDAEFVAALARVVRRDNLDGDPAAADFIARQPDG